jgi:peptide/nickel transport system permease protein
MARFVLRRLLLAVPTVLGVTVVVFLTVKLIPGNPVAALAGPSSTPAARAALTHSLGLDRAMPIQYFDWLRNFVTGNFGTSIARQQPVRPMVMSAFNNTLILAVAGAVVAGVGGLLLGALGALWRRKGIGRAASAFSTVSVSAPQYSVALLLLIFLSVSHPIFPSGGMHNATGGGGFPSLLDHLVLPAIAAGLAPMGVIARMFRASLLEVLSQDFVLSLQARGLSRARVVWHAVHNTVPTLFTVAGLQLGFLMGGVIFVETIFSWPGLGQLVYSAISERDFPVIEGGAFVIAVALVLLNLLADVGHAAVDPRVRA